MREFSFSTLKATANALLFCCKDTLNIDELSKGDKIILFSTTSVPGPLCVNYHYMMTFLSVDSGATAAKPNTFQYKTVYAAVILMPTLSVSSLFHA